MIKMKIYIIRFDRNSYEVRIGFNENIFFADGSGDYTLTVEDPQILEAEVKENGKRVTIHAKKKGETTLIITDNIAGGTVKLKIKY